MGASPQIFISYARTDEALACRLADDLARSGAHVWIDIQHARVGRHWARSIEQALSESHLLLVVLSPEALRTRYVALTWQTYLEAYRPVVPVLARPCDPPGALRSRQPVDFARESAYSRAFHQLTVRLLESSMRVRRGFWSEDGGLLPITADMIPPAPVSTPVFAPPLDLPAATPLPAPSAAARPALPLAPRPASRPAPVPAAAAMSVSSTVSGLDAVRYTLRGLRSRLLGGAR